MARARNIKPGLFKNEILGVADPLYTLLFEGLWVLADREGRLEDRPLRIKAEVFPYREGVDINAMLGWLCVSGFVRRYRVSGSAFIEIAAFTKHQNPHKNEPESVIPGIEQAETKTEDGASSTELIGSAPADSLSLDSGFRIVSTSAKPPSPPVRKKSKTPMPADFGISERVRKWATEKGFDRLEEHLDALKRKVAANGYEKVSWDDFLMEAIREDWAKLRGRGANGSAPPPTTRSQAPATNDYLAQQAAHRALVEAERIARKLKEAA